MTRPRVPAAAGELELLTRHGCHLCEELLAELADLLPRYGLTVRLRDIDDDPALAARYGRRIPVLRKGPVVLCEGPADRAAVQRALALAAD